MNREPGTPMKILVTGVTGYIGGRLAPRLIEAGHTVRGLVRDARRAPPQLRGAEIAVGDAFTGEGLDEALRGMELAYYFIHSMLDAGAGFRERDMEAARRFGTAARAAGVARIIYLGGLGADRAALSDHLRSRQEVGDILRQSGVPVTEFRAAVIVGSGSLSFEMVRYLTERLPIIICPRWTDTRCQPIAIRDVLAYLVACLEEPRSINRIVEIGGADILTYGGMMQTYARIRGLRRRLFHVPLLTLRLSSYWVNLVTPIPSSIARPLMMGVRNEAIVRDPLARDLFPSIVPIRYAEAVRLALERLEKGPIETAWSGALSAVLRGTPEAVQLSHREGLIAESRSATVDAPPARVFAAVCAVGGRHGWPTANWSWRARGLLDRLLGGVGMRRGRPEGRPLRAGDCVDFWRVENIETDRQLRLRAEMKLPGLAWLQFDLTPREGGGTELRQTAFFAPKGLAGLLYWWALYPIHRVIFARMVRALARRTAAPHPVDL